MIEETEKRKLKKEIEERRSSISLGYLQYR